MPPKKRIDQAAIIVLDVGRNVSNTDEKNGTSFFTKARECAIRLIERKITSQGKNLLGVMLLGSKKTKNLMAVQCKGAFKHIEIFSDLGDPTWKLVREIPDKPSESKGDWVDAIIVAAEHFKAQSDYNIESKKIVLMTNFSTPTANSHKDIEMILEGLKEDNYEIDVIGVDVFDENLKGEQFELARKFIEETNGVTATFDCTMNYLLFHKKKAASATPWNVDLSIGPNIKIPVSVYIRVRDEPAVKNWNKHVRDPVTTTASTTESIQKVTEFVVPGKQATNKLDLIKGYNYGHTIIPCSEHDKSLLYESGEKCLSVYGFTEADKISWQSLSGDGVSYLFGKKDDKKAQLAVRCLVECLQRLNLVGIVRRVYNNNNAPKMFALMPVIDTNDFVCLSLVGLCFKDEIKYMSFPSTKSKKFNCTDEQVNAFKSLIKAMDLTKAYDETFDDAEAFPIAQTVSPYTQYILDCIGFRALNPEKPLPEPREEILNLFKVPTPIENRSKEHIEKLKSLFVLNKVEKKERKKKIQILDDEIVTPINGSDEQKPDITPKITLPVKTNEVEHISTLDPVGDYIKLKNKNKSLADLATEMTTAIENLIYCNIDGNYTKAFDAIMHLRKECVDSDPSIYNIWLQKFKVALNDRKKDNVITMISDKNVNYILKSENSSSTYETEESHNDTQLYENDTIPNSGDLTIQSEVNDMFDEF